MGAAWFNEARFGMFVHFGLYSLHGLGEWHMYFDRVPASEYNKLADQFNPESFDARELVALAKQAGAGYVVFGTRHHEGYCLWDTKTTDFNTVQGPARRDFVREFVEACREEGLRVGLYYSIMSWQWPAIFDGPAKDPEGWSGMVAETHAQIRELMTEYGQIDYLWYDGCVVPGMGDAAIRVKFWKADELNAMARSLQPDILINDRSGLPEDVTTPEQYLTPGPEGRLWECCQTIGTSWGWSRIEDDLKDADTLIRQLIFCARYGGNFLLNISPLGNGSLDAQQVERMRAIGRWMEVNSEAIRGSERTPFTEALHVLGEATSRSDTVYFHLNSWSQPPHRVAGITEKIVSAHLLGSDETYPVEQRLDGTATILGLPVSDEISTTRVLALTLSGNAPRNSPPSLLYQRDTGRHVPAEAPLHSIDGWKMQRQQILAFDAEFFGHYDLEFCVIAHEATRLHLQLDGEILPPLLVPCGEYPVTLQLKELALSEGEHLLEMKSDGPLFAPYLWRLQPRWETIPSSAWTVIGPFPTEFRPQAPLSKVRAALDHVFPPEEEFAPDRSYIGAGELEIAWQTNSLTGNTVNFARICGLQEFGVCYARAEIVSSRAVTVEILLACDWWAKLFVNGREVESSRDRDSHTDDGAWFTDWKPMPARVQLEEGINILLVKCHPGSTDNWFTFFHSSPHDFQLNS